MRTTCGVSYPLQIRDLPAIQSIDCFAQPKLYLVEDEGTLDEVESLDVPRVSESPEKTANASFLSPTRRQRRRHPTTRLGG